jgi:uncharacterized protein YukE
MAISDAIRIKVPPELAGAGPFLHGKAGTLGDALDQLRKRVVALQETWREGTAQRAYQGYQAQWDTAAASLLGPTGILNHVGDVMDKVWANYVEVEATNTAGWPAA